MRTRLSLAACLLLSAAGFGRAADPVAVPAVGKPIDVAICLDISGSMDGLIDSAKIKLWTIVNDLAKIQPAPTLRVALYSYGCDAYDRNKGWVVKDCELTQDLDEIYRKLNAFRTNGGTEYHTRVARDAIKDLNWSKDKDALKMIFVCGNEPATQDRETPIKHVADLAKVTGVFVNTIYCGQANHPEAQAWRDFAVACGGKYSNIDQDRAKSAVVIATPFDKELLELSGKMNATYCWYGKDGKEKQLNQAAQDANAAKAAPGAALERASTKATALYRNDANDLIDRLKNDPKFDIKTLKEEELPEELKKLKPEERVEFVKKKAEEREAINKKVSELSAKRAKFIAEESKKTPKSEADKAFDEAIKTTVREQAAAKGIKIPE